MGEGESFGGEKVGVENVGGESFEGRGAFSKVGGGWGRQEFEREEDNVSVGAEGDGVRVNKEGSVKVVRSLLSLLVDE